MSDAAHIFGPMVNIPYPVRPDICLHCKKDRLLPIDWHKIPYESWAIQCRCGECGAEYCAIMSQLTAEKWDYILAQQFRAIEENLGG